MAMATINAEAVRSTIGHVLGILGDLQARLDNDEETELSQRVNSVLVSPLALPAKSNDTVDARWYAEKCKELDDMEHKYTSKCKAYDQLLLRFQQVQGKQPEQTPSLTSLTARQNASKMYTFDDFDELEKKMCVPGSGTRGKRTNCDVLVSPARDAPGVVQHRAGAALDNVTPTKRPRKEPTNVRKPNLLSSPPPPPLTFRGTKTHRLNHTNKRTFHDPAEQRLRNEAAAGVKCSSQETRMDSSELGMPSENIIELCPATDDEHSDCDNSNGRDQWREILDQMDVPRNQTKRSPPINSATKPSSQRSQRSVDLQRILDAIGDCQPCRTFYSMPGLALPKRDPLTLCMHKKKGQSVCSAPELVQTPVRNVVPAARSERRPSTPEHFWDIDYFPAIRTAGPEVLRKSRR